MWDLSGVFKTLYTYMLRVAMNVLIFIFKINFLSAKELCMCNNISTFEIAFLGNVFFAIGVKYFNNCLLWLSQEQHLR